jgi:hypothetical protein
METLQNVNPSPALRGSMVVCADNMAELEKRIRLAAQN